YQPVSANTATVWFDSVLKSVSTEVADLFSKYRLSEALMAIYKLFWDEFSSWYLEMVKPAYGAPIDPVTYNKTLEFFNALLLQLHPFMPFITEELWQHISDRREGESIMITQLPALENYKGGIITSMDKAKEIVSGVRTIRLQKNIPNKNRLQLQIIGEHDSVCDSVLVKLANLSDIKHVSEKDPTAVTFMVGTVEYAVPVGDCIDIDAELRRLEEDLKYQRGFLKAVTGKLSNERFVANAPVTVVELERKKLADAESKIKSIEEIIAVLKK
ncbi:MAG: class I tRNA ligase family protein, partial [Bacteroidales bacterium]